MNNLLRVKYIFFILLILIFYSCSNNELPKVEQLEAESEFKLFNMLDPYPDLKYSLSDIDQHKMNLLFADVVNSNVEDAKILFSIYPDMISPLVDLLNNSNKVLGRIIDQNNLNMPLDETDYSGDFYSFLDNFFKEEFEISKDVVAIMQKSMAYLLDNYPDQIEEKTQIFLDFLTDDETQNIKTLLPLLQEGLAKILIIDNKEMIVNGLSTDLGNSVRGFDALLLGFNQIFADDKIARDVYIDFLYSGSEIFSAKVKNKKAATIFRELLVNIEKYSTEGGNIYDHNTDYKNDSDGNYVNTSFINGAKELWPSFVSLFIKAKGSWEDNNLPDYSKIYDPENGESILEYLTHQFHQLKVTAGIDLNDVNSGFGNGEIEKSLLKMIEYNAYGEKRSLAAYQVSYLDHLLYTLSSAYDFGFKTRLSSDGEPNSNHGRGHGSQTNGVITLNDTLYSMTTGQKVDTLNSIHNAYNLALDQRTQQADYIYRSANPFTSSQRNEHKFYMGYDFPALTLLNGFSVGDAGLPNGGNHVENVKKDSGIASISTISNQTNGEDYKTYYPLVENGFGDLNTSRWVMGWMARSCWEGEGPYYSTKIPESKPSTIEVDVNNDGNKKTANIYYLPSGEIYSYVYKENPNDSNTWKYFYPVNKGDKEDNSAESWGDLKQRTNKYQHQWHSDYFLFRTDYSDGDDTTKYYSPESVISNSGTDKYLMAKYNNKEVIADASTSEAGVIWYNEKIKEHDSKRECASQEEAMIRNFQWMMFEKKIVFTIPMRAHVHQEIFGLNVYVDSVILNIIEANGIAGVANAKKGNANAHWNIKGDEGLDLGTPQKNTNINYGDSHEPGDSRVVIFMKEDGHYLTGIDASGDKVDMLTIFNNIFGTHHVLPDAVGENLAPITNMAFIANQDIESSSDIIGDESNEIWQNRNKLFPIVISLVSNLHRNTHYVTEDMTKHNYNFSGSHRYPIKILRDLIFILGQPMIRHFETENGRWVPRMNKEANFAPDTAYFAPEGYGVDYRPKENLKSITNLLSENEFGESDGLIPLLAQTRVITKFLNFLQIVGRDEGIYLDIDKTSKDYNQWGARRKIFYGLEQIMTSIKSSKGIATERGYFNITHPEWMFEKKEEDLDLDIILNEVIGSKSLEKGISLFVNNRPLDKDWENFNFAIDTMSALFSDKSKYGNKYRILDNITNITTAILTGFDAKPTELTALRHSLAMFLTYYDKVENKWIKTKELESILTKNIPEILLVYKGNYKPVFTVLNDFAKENGLVEYLLDQLITDGKSKDVISDIFKLFSSDVMNSSNSKFWKDLPQLMLEVSEMLEETNEYTVEY